MTDYLTLSELPGKFKVRATELDDVTAVAEITSLCDIENIGQTEMSETELLSEWQAPNFDLSRSRIIETNAGQIVGYIDLFFKSMPKKNHVWGRIHPDFRGQGIGTFMLNWGEALARQLSSSLPPEEKPVMQAHCHEKETYTKTLFQNHGMTLERCYFTMQIDFDSPPPTPTFPEHIHLTTFAEFDNLPAIWQANNESFRDHYGHVEIPEEEGIRNWQHIIDTVEFFDPKLWFVGMDGDEIAGVCLCQPQTTEDPEKAHVHNLAVRRPWRQQGLGMALLHHAFGEFYKRGAKRADLAVDASSLTGATRLYKKAGMRRTHTYESFHKPLR